MSKKTLPDLYDLIYSLSPSEKRYVKLNFQNNTGKPNILGIKLFELIVKNEGKSIKEIEKKITFTQHSSKLKNALYFSILDHLEKFYSNKSTSINLRKLTNQIESLSLKGLHKQCLVLAEKGLKEAEQAESYEFQISIINWYLISLRELENKNYRELIQELGENQLKIIDFLKQEKELMVLRDSIFGFIKKYGRLVSTETRKMVKEFLNHPQLQSYNTLPSFNSKITFNSIHSHIYQSLGEPDKSYHYQKQNILLYEKHPHRIKTQQFLYMSLLNNYSLDCFFSGDYITSRYYFSKIADIKPITEQISIKQYSFLSANQLDLYLNIPDIKSALNMVVYIEKGLEKYARKLSPLYKIVIHNNLCHLFFITGNYKKALKYNNLILNQKNTIYRLDIFRFARIMNLLIHYERGDSLSIDYFYEATKKYLRKEESNYMFEGWFIVFFKNLLKIKESDKKKFFKEQELTLLKLLTQKKEQKIIEFFNFLAWIRTKHEKISYEDAIKSYNSSNFSNYIKNRKESILK